MITKPRWRPIAAACVTVFLFSTLVQPAAVAREKNDKNKEKPYALIFGTAYGPDDRPLYGVKVTIHSQGKKHQSWNLFSDHRGEFAQRVPAGTADYLIKGEAEYAPVGRDGKPELSKKKKLKGETRVRIDNDERKDIGLHLE